MEKLDDIFHIGLRKFDGYETFLASRIHKKEMDESYRYGSERLLTYDVVRDDVDFKESRRYEVKVGKIEWGDLDAVIVIFNDISKSEKIRELKLLHRNKDKLLATVSHELRTPLNGIIGMVEVAFEKVENSKVRKYLSIARNSANRLLLMINDILDISQIQRGDLRLNKTLSNIHILIDSVLPLIKLQIKKKNLQLIYENECPHGTLIDVDPMRFQQILLNLLNNAFKFTQECSIKVKVYMEKI